MSADIERSGMVVADLHVHTTNSDGQLSLDELPAIAREAGVEAVAVTDHDRPHPALDAPASVRDGVTVVHGVELRVDAGDQRLDLLGYGLRRTDAIEDLVEHLQTDRAERGRAIVECVEDRLGVPLDVDVGPGLGRPHIARAIAERTDRDVQWAFDELIGDDCPCYRARDVPSFERGRAVLADACALVGLAHPFRYPDPAAALDRCEALDAVERWYPYDDAVDERLVERAIDRHDLLPTGGSDAHDRRLGLAGLDRGAYDCFADALRR